MRRVVVILLLLFLGGCSRDAGKLSRTLQNAVDDEKLSAQKKVEIENEYDAIEDDSLANVYAKRIIGLIESGGDSSHIQVARKSILKKAKKKS